MGVRVLDEILDYGYELQPLDQNRKCIDDWRSIGLGIFGLADMLVALRIRYGSDKSLDLAYDIAECIFETALDESCELAKEKGTFGKYDWECTRQSPLIQRVKENNPLLYDKIKTYGLRNGTLISIAPTGTISTMCGLSGGIEPLFDLYYERTTHALQAEGKYFKVVAKSFADLMIYEGYDPQNDEHLKLCKEKYKEFLIISQDIPPMERIAMQSVLQTFVDNAISSTINLKNEVTPQEVFDIYFNAWKMGCKGITVFRNGCMRDAILITKGSTKAGEEDKEVVFDSIAPIKRKNLPMEMKLEAEAHYKHTACVRNMHGFTTKFDGNLFEIFTFNSGGCSSNIATITRLCSLALRSGVKVSEIVSELRETKCEGCKNEIRKGRTDISLSCGNAIADMLEDAYTEDIPQKEEPPQRDGLITCPSCGKKAYLPQGKCGECRECGFSKCS